MGIVAGGAGSLLIDDVKTMPPGLAGAAIGAETLVAQNAIAAVALVTKRVIRGTLSGVIGRDQAAFQQW